MSGPGEVFNEPWETEVPVPSLGRRLGHWFGRHATTLAACAPAILAAGGVAGLACAQSWTGPSALLDMYRREAVRSAGANDLGRLCVCLDRACLLDPNEATYRFELAKALAAQGDQARAIALFAQLAPLDGRGHLPAQLWMATTLLGAREVTRSQLQDAEAHLLRALETDPDQVQANNLLGNLYARTGRATKAIPHLTRSTANHPEALLVLADAFTAQSLPEEARKWAEEALKEYARRNEADPDNEGARLGLAAAHVRRRDHAQAVRALQEGLARRDSEDLRKALGDVFVDWVDAVERERPDTLDERLTLLDQGLRACPAHARLLERIARLMREEGPESKRARERMEDLLTDGKAAPIAHFFLGNDAHRRGKADEARIHYEQANRLAPEMPIVANNLAWFLAEGPNADPDRALALVDMAIARDPKELRFRSTRGHVLVRLRRWPDAVSDLEAALPLEAGLPELHLDLAAAYEGLGLTDLAASHRRKAAKSGTGTAPGTR